MRSQATEYLPVSYRLYGASVVRMLSAWFHTSARSFPWRRSAAEAADDLARRGRINDPYIVLVSEVMLQQTQTSRVAEALPRFVAAFPSIEALAGASRGEVLRAWSGLGYNSRALRLHATAQDILERFGGEFPREPATLRDLRGIGPYTAAAIACFAYGADVPVVDVNIQRVLSRLFYRCHSTDQRMHVDAVSRLDDALLPRGEAYWWHQALMDVGATVCTARRPACDRCPLVTVCLSAYPSSLQLYAHAASVEPLIAGEPRRLWRGRIVEALRRCESVVVKDLIDSLLNVQSHLERTHASESVTPTRLLELIQSLIAEGICSTVAGVVREGEALDERARISLVD